MTEWLGPLIDYDAGHGTPPALTLSEYLDCGGNYDASAKALSVHRSTIKYRLQRIRQVSGHDLGLPDVSSTSRSPPMRGGPCRRCASPDLGALAVLPG